MRWLRKKRVAIPLGLVLFYLLFGFLAVGPIARGQLLGRLPPLLHRTVSIESIAFNPLTLSVRIKALAVAEADGSPLLAFDELFVNAAGTDLVRGIIGFDEIRLTKPVVGVGLNKDGSLSFADLLPPKSDEPPPAPAEPSKPRVVRVALLVLSDGTVRFNDLSRPTPFHAELTPLAFELKDFSTEAGKDSPYTFNARLGNTRLGWNGDFSASPLHSRGELLIEGLDLTSFQPYLEGNTQLRLTSGTATLGGRYTLDGAAGGVGLVLEQAKVAVAGLAVSPPGEGEPLVTLERFEALAEKVDTLKKQVGLSQVTLAGASITARRLAGGEIELAELAKAPRSAVAAPPAPPAAAAPPPTPSGKAAPAAAPWHVTLPRLALERFKVRWEDATLDTPASVPLEDLTVTLADLEFPFAKPVGLTMSTKVQAGQLSVKGPLTLDPFGAQLAVELSALPLVPFWPYAAQSVDATLASGTLDAKLAATMAGGEVSASGDLALNGFRLDDAAGAALVTLERLGVEKLSYTQKPSGAQLGTLSLAKARLRLELDDKGALNFSKLTKPPKAAAAPPEPAPAGKPEPPFALKLSAVRLDDVRLDVLDRTVAPPAAISLQRLTGKVQNITTPTLSKMRIDLAARLDGAPLALNGWVRPAGKDSFADLKFTLGGFDLPLTSSYAVKHVAQPIEKGKLSLELVWKVENQQLDGKNRLKVDQLKFGDRVADPDPDAKHLPLGLAVAILSDREGLIDLDVPVTGNLADPEFAWVPLVWKTLLNIVLKVGTAPFSLLAGLVSGDPEALKSIAFAPGEAQPLPAELPKVDNLLKVLSARPALHLEMSPDVDLRADGIALSRQALRAQLARTRGTDGGTLDEVAWRAWVQQKYRAGLGDAGVTVEPPFEQAELAVLERAKVPAERLDALRRDRAEWVQSALTGDGGAEPERVYLTRGGADAGAGKAEVALDLK